MFEYIHSSFPERKRSPEYPIFSAWPGAGSWPGMVVWPGMVELQIFQSDKIENKYISFKRLDELYSEKWQPSGRKFTRLPSWQSLWPNLWPSLRPHLRPSLRPGLRPSLRPSLLRSDPQWTVGVGRGAMGHFRCSPESVEGKTYDCHYWNFFSLRTRDRTVDQPSTFRIDLGKTYIPHGRTFPTILGRILIKSYLFILLIKNICC